MNFKKTVSFVSLFSGFDENMRPSRKPQNVDHFAKNIKSEGPLISVILPSYNVKAYLAQSIESILQQSFTDFELILIDNASTDGSDQILKSFTDPRIRLYINESNIGYTRSLNRGLSLARGRYIARMDADDISQKTRFEKQVKFLESNPDYGIIGCSYHVINAEGKIVGTRHMPENDLEIRWKNLLCSPFCHPAVMIRKSILDQHQFTFDVEKEPAEDYHLWNKIISHSQGFNLAETLVHYRIHGKNESTLRAEEQQRQIESISLTHIQQAFPDFSISPEEVKALRKLVIFEPGQSTPLSPELLTMATELYLTLWKRFSNKYSEVNNNRFFQQKSFDELILLFQPNLRSSASFRTLIKLFLTFPYPFINALKKSLLR